MAEIQLWEGEVEIRLVAETRYSASRALYWHRHPFYEIGLVLSGECFWRVGSRTGPRARHRLRAGEAILLPPETWHSEEVSAGGEARLAWIGFGCAVPPPVWTGRPVALGDDAAEVIQAFLSVYREHSQPGNGPRIRLALQTILLLISRQAQAREREGGPVSDDGIPGLNPRQLRSVEAAAHTLRENLNSRLTIAQIAAYHSLSAAHFSTLFHRRHGTTPRAFLRRARVEKAEELLALSDLSVKEIAAITGFVDSPHLCKAFRALRGTTPRSVRTAGPRA